jgi:glucose-6-phosphate isomerase
MMTATPSQAWAILKRHARDEIATLRLQDLCNDNDRVSSLVAVHNSTLAANDAACNSMLLVDLSRQRMTLETLNHLLRLSVTRGVRKYITRLAWGQNNPDAPLHQTNTAPVGERRHSSRRRGVSYQHYAKHNAAAKESYAIRDNANATSSSIGQTNDDHQPTNNSTPQEQHQPTYPTIMPSMHLALRAPKDQGLHMLTCDGVNALTAIHREWDRLERLSNSIRIGTWRGVSGQMIRSVVVVGRGVAIQALQFIEGALRHDETAIMASRFGLDPTGSANDPSDWGGRLLRRTATSTTHANVKPRKLYFLTSVDPLAAAALVSELDAASTMVISVALQGNEETGLATKTLKTWLLQQLASTQQSKRVDSVLGKHMLLVTGNDTIATSINKPESVFLIPEHSRCEAFINFSAMTLLVSIVLAYKVDLPCVASLIDPLP